MERRIFISRALQVMGIALVAPKIFAEQTRGARPGAPVANATGTALPFVDPKNPAAAALHYSLKKSDVKDPALKVEKGGVAFAQQQCSGCGFYNKVGKKDGVEAGSCTLFSGQFVKSDAWCVSWNKKA